nr:hypothetical protein GPGIFMOB_00290 [Acinetobacter gerneri]
MDESALFRMIGQMREIVTSAQKATRKARRDADRRQHLKTSARPDKPVPPDTDIADPQAEQVCHPPNRSTRLRSGSRGRISHHRPVPPAAGGPGLGPSSGGRAHPAPSRRPLDRLSARSRGAEPAGSPLCVAKQATHAQPAAGWPDQQWQVDDRREVPPHPPGQLRRRPGAHPGVGRADAVRAVRDPLLRRAARRDGRAARAHAHGCRKWSNWLWHCCARSACACW